ncbi:MAG: division/cell wall cluster transcriptional repressor MraZ [Anaerolineaceae bacterium]|nr:division/cell wall cluster transcriptional repressor MraZ [Anaerolineaceae bacterium]
MKSGKKWNAGASRRFALKGVVEHMFLGQYEHTMDEKGRLTIPARFRESIADGAYITRGFDQNLVVWTAPAFELIYQRINQLSITDPLARQLRRLIFSHADRVEIDRVGRILIPQFLRETLQLDSTLMVVGAGETFEIWSTDRWAEQEAQLQDSESNARQFAALDLPVH